MVHRVRGIYLDSSRCQRANAGEHCRQRKACPRRSFSEREGCDSYSGSCRERRGKRQHDDPRRRTCRGERNPRSAGRRRARDEHDGASYRRARRADGRFDLRGATP